MAMEVDVPAKRLLKHTVPVLMIVALLFTVLVVALGGRGAISFNRPQDNVLAKGLVTRVFRVRHTPNGLAEITLNKSTAPNFIAGSGLSDGLSQTGRVARLSFEVQ